VKRLPVARVLHSDMHWAWESVIILALRTCTTYLCMPCREHHGDVLSWGDQHDAAEAFELLSDGLAMQLQQWINHSPACIGEVSLTPYMCSALLNA
jgi:hypothetical protein